MISSKLLNYDSKTWNGHTHTEFCPHGSGEDTELFIKRAIKSGFKTYTITEHFPMVPDFYRVAKGAEHAITTAAMPIEELPAYFEKMNYLKKKYSGFIKILVGFEIDYIEQFSDWTSQMLVEYQEQIDDAILSVHFLPTKTGLRAVDENYKDFCDGVLREYQTPIQVANAYLETILKAVKWQTDNKPKRYGHITLYRKWIRDFPVETIWEDEKTKELTDRILTRIQKNHEMLDCNMSGLKRSTQQEPSPTWEIIHQAQAKGIKLVYGSDAHAVSSIDQGYTEFLNMGE